MNQHIVPVFEMEEDGSIPSSSGFFHDRRSKMAEAEEEELVELLWQNGQVVMQNQTQRPLKKPLLPPLKFHLEDAHSLLHHVLPHKPPGGGGDVGPSTAPEQQLYIHEDEMASWLHYPLDDAADFCSDLIYPQPTPADRRPETKPSVTRPPPIPPPRRPPEGEPDKAAANFAMFSRLKGKAAAQAQSASEKMGGMESTVVDSSVTPARVASGSRAAGSVRDVGGTCDPTVTSSSGGSGASACDRTSKPPASDDRKRKGRERDEVEGLSEDAEFDYVEEKKAARGSSSTRRTRAAEVHNLSERRRRDRINEKMKALQELIPHCNKSDKASMLDEAIEYLKSLQLQVQMMSIGCGMAPVVFPGIQHYMSPMGMGMGMRMGMGMGVGMNMDVSSSSLNRPQLPFPPVLPPTPAQGSAPHMGQSLPIPPYRMQHIPLTDPPRARTGQTGPSFNLVGLQIPSTQPHMHVADPYQQYLGLHHISMPPQAQPTAPPASTCNETEAHDGNKPG